VLRRDRVLDSARHGSPGLDSVECGSDSTSTPAGRPVPRLHRIVIIVMENKGCNEVIGSSDAPYTNGLAARYAFASRFYALQRPSLPNYLGLTSGTTFGLTDNCTDCSFRGRNIVDQLDKAHISWKAYMESTAGALRSVMKSWQQNAGRGGSSPQCSFASW
jgi:hypothetical protein